MTTNTVKRIHVGAYQVIDCAGDVVGEFNFSRWRGPQGRVMSRCAVHPKNAEPFETSHCYFADVKRDAVNGSLFS